MSVLQQPNIKPIDAIICALLYDRADYNEFGVIYTKISHDYLSQASGASLPSVKRSIKILLDNGIITEQARTGKANMYFLAENILPPKRRKKLD